MMVLEVMGRYAGWIAIFSGVAGGADVILIPEIPFNYERVCDKIREREGLGKHFTIVVVAEGARQRGGEFVTSANAPANREARLGGIGTVVAHEIEARSGKEARACVLGHLQRGGSPTSFDRALVRSSAPSGSGTDRGRRLWQNGRLSRVAGWRGQHQRSRWTPEDCASRGKLRPHSAGTRNLPRRLNPDQNSVPFAWAGAFADIPDGNGKRRISMMAAVEVRGRLSPENLRRLGHPSQMGGNLRRLKVPGL